MDFGELTVLFCNLVDSPVLAGQLDPHPNLPPPGGKDRDT
jgi:hypothetical protein